MNRGRIFVTGSGVRGLWLMRAAIVLGTGLLLWRLGPFGTFGDLGPFERLAYWVGLTALQWFLSVVMLGAIPNRWPRSVRLFAAAVLAAVQTSFAVAWAEMLLRINRDLGPADILQIAGDVALIGVPLLFVTHWVLEPPGAEGSTTSSHEETSPAHRLDWLMHQVPPEKRGRLLALGAEDHYVRVVTDGGEHLLLMRFGDALAALPADLGCQVHRGWWVAKGAAVSEHRSGDRPLLELHNGVRVPVSRTHMQSARAAGLLR